MDSWREAEKRVLIWFGAVVTDETSAEKKDAAKANEIATQKPECNVVEQLLACMFQVAKRYKL